MDRNRRALLDRALRLGGAALWALPGVRAARAAPGGPAVAATTAPSAPGPAALPPYPERDDVQAFLAEAAAGHGIDVDDAARTLALARYSADAQRLNTPGGLPPSSRNWLAYRASHVDERRIRAGVAFLREQRDWLLRAQDTWGVPPEIVTAIVGIETLFGRVMGDFRTLDVLATLSFDYTRRAALYRSELVQFLLLCREHAITPTALRGSFAGAVGLPQFMPSSIRAHAVDFDGDGVIDLVSSVGDAIGSVARYLATQGWQRDLGIAWPAQADPAVAAELAVGIVPRQSWAELAARGVQVTAATPLPDTLPVLLVDLPYLGPGGTSGAELRVGTVNLAAILHYNRSYMYGCAVADLAEAIARRSANGA